MATDEAVEKGYLNRNSTGHLRKHSTLEPNPEGIETLRPANNAHLVRLGRQGRQDD